VFIDSQCPLSRTDEIRSIIHGYVHLLERLCGVCASANGGQTNPSSYSGHSVARAAPFRCSSLLRKRAKRKEIRLVA
jgi:hypothetical protein